MYTVAIPPSNHSFRYTVEPVIMNEVHSVKAVFITQFCSFKPLRLNRCIQYFVISSASKSAYAKKVKLSLFLIM
jgi:hypothetical protein